MSRKTLISILLIAAILLAVSAVVTLLPASSPMVSDMGYHTLCTFAPWSTITLLFLAGLGWMVRRYINTQPS